MPEKFIVIESTPGYLPDDLYPLVTDDYQEAVAYANELADQLEDQEYESDRSFASADNMYAIHCFRTGEDDRHDLGRYISVEIFRGDDAEDSA